MKVIGIRTLPFCLSIFVGDGGSRHEVDAGGSSQKGDVIVLNERGVPASKTATLLTACV